MKSYGKYTTRGIARGSIDKKRAYESRKFYIYSSFFFFSISAHTRRSARTPRELFENYNYSIDNNESEPCLPRATEETRFTILLTLKNYYDIKRNRLLPYIN